MALRVWERSVFGELPYVLLEEIALDRGAYRDLVLCFLGAESGSARGHQKAADLVALPFAIFGTRSCLCSSLPHLLTTLIVSGPCAETKSLNLESLASSSMQASPYSTALFPGQP
jgi:hypothetical protein